MIPVYINARTPGADPAKTVEWTSICRDKSPWIFVYFQKRRSTSRWESVERKRPFFVSINSCSPDRAISSHATLEAAVKAADKQAKEYAEYYAAEKAKKEMKQA